MKKILLSYDGHPSSAKALEVAKHHALTFKARLDIVNVVVREKTDQHEDIEEAEKILAKAEKGCQRDNIECTTKLVIKGATPAEALLNYAEEKGYDLIIIGIRRTSQLGKLLLGSNAQNIILNAPCPVLSINKNV